MPEPRRMTTVDERLEIRGRCEALLAQNIDRILGVLESSGRAHDIFVGMCAVAVAGNKESYASQPEVIKSADGFAAGLIERYDEALYTNSNNPVYVAFVREHKRLPQDSDKLYG